MRAKMICLSLLLLTLFCQFAIRATADNEGDWVPTNNAKWWWKYVYPGGDPHPNWLKDVSIVQVVVGSDAINPTTGDMTTGVVCTFKNTTSSYVKCDGSVTILHTLRAADGSVKYSQVMAR